MFFFRFELSLFDEKRQTIYLYPDTQPLDKDEIPAFSEAALTANPVFKRYVKQLKTDVVDIKYELYETVDVVDDLNDETFEQLLNRNKLNLIDENAFCVICGKMKPKSSRKGNNYMLVAIVACIAVILLLGAMSTKKDDQPATSGAENSSTVIDISQIEPEESSDNPSDISKSDENSDIPEESSSDNSQSSVNPPESISSSSDTPTSSADTPSNESTTTSSVTSSTPLQTNIGSVNSLPTESTSSVSDVPQNSTSESNGGDMS